MQLAIDLWDINVMHLCWKILHFEEEKDLEPSLLEKKNTRVWNAYNSTCNCNCNLAASNTQDRNVKRQNFFHIHEKDEKEEENSINALFRKGFTVFSVFRECIFVDDATILCNTCKVQCHCAVWKKNALCKRHI